MSDRRPRRADDLERQPFEVKGPEPRVVEPEGRRPFEVGPLDRHLDRLPRAHPAREDVLDRRVRHRRPGSCLMPLGETPTVGVPATISPTTSPTTRVRPGFLITRVLRQGGISARSSSLSLTVVQRPVFRPFPESPPMWNTNVPSGNAGILRRTQPWPDDADGRRWEKEDYRFPLFPSSEGERPSASSAVRPFPI